MDAGPYQVTNFSQTPKTITFTWGVSLRGINFVGKRGTAQTAS
jgi:hypothetical protein